MASVVQVTSWGDEKGSLQLEIDFMMRRRNEEDEEGKRGRKEENERFHERAKRSAAQLGRAVSWRRGCNVSSAPNDAKMTLSDAKWRTTEEDEKEDEKYESVYRG